MQVPGDVMHETRFSGWHGSALERAAWRGGMPEMSFFLCTGLSFLHDCDASFLHGLRVSAVWDEAGK